MEELSIYSSRRRCPCRPGLDCESIAENRRPFLIPSRFIAVCPKGHIEDFPFMRWVHRDGEWDESHRLRLLPGRSSANLSGIKVACSCGKSESMAGTFNFDPESGGALHRIGVDCSANMPWLGIADEREGQCGEFLRVVQRGASNVYFPLTLSSIYLPLWGDESSARINDILNTPNVWDVLTAELDDGKYVQNVRCENVAAIYRVDFEALKQAAQKKLDVTTSPPDSEEEFRWQEYEAIRKGKGSETTDLMVEICNLERYPPELSDIFKNICLVRKLRETRVLKGFTRLLPNVNAESETILPISDNEELRWLPANVVFGEGIFLEFSEEAFADWTENPLVVERVIRLSNRFNRGRQERGLPEVSTTAKYVLLHTFAHALIAQLSFDCGYGSAALRERIYCDTGEPSHSMQGILVYTASGDSEGTLGGLVRQGEPDRFHAIVNRSIERTQWCSSDPVCIESSGQGTNVGNYAACHSCVLLPETSCEIGNRILDRGLMVGTPEHADIGFFTKFLDVMST